MNSFTPTHFIDLIERERRWIKLLISAIHTRRELRTLDYQAGRR